MDNGEFTAAVQPIPPQDLSGIVGYRFVYTYANGWQYEVYLKNATTIDYRIHSGMVGGRWVKDQNIALAQLDDDHYRFSWTEPTGTSVSVSIMPGKRRLYGVIFFPHWVTQHAERTRVFQNDHLGEMAAFRDQGPTYPIEVISEFASVTLFEYVGTNDEAVIAVAPGDLPQGWSNRTDSTTLPPHQEDTR